MTNPTTCAIRCVFYSHPWSVLLLTEAGLGDFEQDVLVELAETSILSHVFASRRAPQQSLATVLSRGQANKSRLAALFAPKHGNPLQASLETFAGLPAPLVLAPADPTPAAVQSAALLCAAAQAGNYRQITLLLHYEEAARFSALFDYVDKFHFLWDIADLPGEKLVELSRALTDGHEVSPPRWGGFHLCHHGLRTLENAEERRLGFQQLIDEYFPS